MTNKSFKVVGAVVGVLTLVGVLHYTNSNPNSYKTDVVSPTYSLSDPINVRLDFTHHNDSDPTLAIGDIIYITAEMDGNLPADGTIKRTYGINFSTTKGTIQSSGNSYNTTTDGSKVITAVHYSDLLTPGATYYFCVEFGINPDNSAVAYELDPIDYSSTNTAQIQSNCVWSDHSFSFPAAPPDPTACAPGEECLYSDGKDKCEVTPSKMCNNEYDTGFTCEIDGFVCLPFCAIGDTCEWNAICRESGQSCNNYNNTATCYAPGYTCQYCEIGDVCESPTEICADWGHQCENDDGTTSCYGPGVTCPEIEEEELVEEVEEEETASSTEADEEVEAISVESENLIESVEAELALLGSDEDLEAALQELRESIGPRRHLSGSSRLISATISDAKEEVEELVAERRVEQKDEFIDGFIDSHETTLDEFENFVDENDISDDKILFAVERFEGLIDDIKDAIKDDDQQAVAALVDTIKNMKLRIQKWLNEAGYDGNDEESFKEILKHIEEEITDKMDELFEDLEVALDQSIQAIAIKTAKLADKLNAKLSSDFSKRLAKGVENLSAISEENLRKKIIAAKDRILDRIDSIETRLDNSNLNNFAKRKLRNAMDKAATINWCGVHTDDIKERIETAAIALEDDSLSTTDITDIESTIIAAETSNLEECYKSGAAHFKMPMHEWYFPHAEWNYNNGYMRGNSDIDGNPNGNFGQSSPTLRIEAIVMMQRIFDTPLGNTTSSDIPGTPHWGRAAVNGTRASGIDFDWNLRMDKPITRMESAELITEFLKFKKIVNGRAELLDLVYNYSDSAAIVNNDSAAKAIELLTDYGIFEGSTDGKFYPGNSLLRSEFAALNQRIGETFVN